jgi:uncharacterized protein YndB with AHSA1/START domain/DNA-binding transcriptional ArsR family regulator
MSSQMAAYRDTDVDDRVFRALADRHRRLLLDRLNQRNGQTLRELCAGLDMARQSVSKHLDILESADLVVTVRSGREKLHYLNPAPVADIGERWIRRFDAGRVDALASLKRTLEDTTVERPSFVYKTYVRTTPEMLWRALTDPEFTRRYWGLELHSDWQPGSTITWGRGDVTIADPEQVVIESDPYRRLSYTWHTMSEGMGRALGLTDDLRARIAAERRSTVTFDLEEMGPVVKLTVVHEGFDPGSAMFAMISEGWPGVLSDLKTLLETGDTLPPRTERPVPARLGLT